MIVVQPPRKSDGSAIVELSDEIFGEGYLTLSEIHNRFLVVRVNGKFAGFTNTDIWDEEDATGTSGFCLGLIETVAVNPDYRGLNLGTILVGAATALLILDGVNLIECYATTWSDSGICYLKGSLERNGFVIHQHQPQAWKNDNQNFICAACKKKPCLCDATVYRREINTR